MAKIHFLIGLLKKGKICNINLDSGSTFIHYFERKLKVNYRYDKTFLVFWKKKNFINPLCKKIKEDYHQILGNFITKQ